MRIKLTLSFTSNSSELAVSLGHGGRGVQLRSRTVFKRLQEGQPCRLQALRVGYITFREKKIRLISSDCIWNKRPFSSASLVSAISVSELVASLMISGLTLQ